ncbi:MAG: hypothetical protein IT331_12700 [Anaerolineae bacterium]|nr:hypothetical protein [Anaerolineae bacterium]
MIGLFSRKRRLLFLWITLVVLVSVAPFSLAAQTGGITLQVEPFFSGHYKFGEWLPLRVTVTNPGAPVSAQVRVEMSETGGRTSWVVPVDLPTGAQKQFILYVLPTSFAQVARARLVSGTQELARENVPLTLHPNTDYLIGVIAPRTEPFNAANVIELEGQLSRTTRVLPMGLGDLPDRPEGLRVLDALVLSDVDTSALSPAQTRVLTNWVQNGGRLILGGGASAARTLAGLPQELAGEFRSTQGVTELESLEALAAFGDSPVRVEGPFAAALTTGGETVVAQGDQVLVSEKQLGEGRVTYSALDLAASPFDAWAGAPHFWKSILTPGSAYPMNFPPDVSASLIRSRYMAMALQNLPVLALPSLNVLAALLTVYIVLVGPVNYLVLRRLKKLDWGWATIPFLTFLFAVGAFGVSSQLRGSDVILSQVSIIDFAPDGKPSRMESVVGLFSPTRGSFALEIPDGSLVIPMSNAFDPFSTQTNVGSNLEIVETNPLEVRGINLNQGALQAFAIQSPVPEDWRIESDLRIEGERVRGTLVNRSTMPLTDVYLVNGELYVRLGALSPNVPLTLDHAWERSQGAQPMLINGSAPENEVQRQILSARFDYWSGSPQTPRSVMLMGWAASSPLDVRVQDMTAARQVNSLVLMDLRPVYASGPIHLLMNDWRVRELSGRGNRVFCGSVNYTGVRNGEAVLEFMPFPEFAISSVQELVVQVRESFPHTVELQDLDGNWVKQDITSSTDLVVENPARFVRPNGAVRLRISAVDEPERCVLYGIEMQATVAE